MSLIIATKKTVSLYNDALISVFKFFSIPDMARTRNVCCQWKKIADNPNSWRDKELKVTDYVNFTYLDVNTVTFPNTFPNYNLLGYYNIAVKDNYSKCRYSLSLKATLTTFSNLERLSIIDVMCTVKFITWAHRLQRLKHLTIISQRNIIHVPPLFDFLVGTNTQVKLLQEFVKLCDKLTGLTLNLSNFRGNYTLAEIMAGNNLTNLKIYDAYTYHSNEMHDYMITMMSKNTNLTYLDYSIGNLTNHDIPWDNCPRRSPFIANIINLTNLTTLICGTVSSNTLMKFMQSNLNLQTLDISNNDTSISDKFIIWLSNCNSLTSLKINMNSYRRNLPNRKPKKNRPYIASPNGYPALLRGIIAHPVLKNLSLDIEYKNEYIGHRAYGDFITYLHGSRLSEINLNVHNFFISETEDGLSFICNIIEMFIKESPKTNLHITYKILYKEYFKIQSGLAALKLYFKDEPRFSFNVITVQTD